MSSAGPIRYAVAVYRPTRRRWLQGTTAMGALAASGLGLGTGCGDPGAATALVLEVDSTRALIAAWSGFARAATVRLRTADGERAGEFRIELDDDGNGAVDATGLVPATAYLARVTADDGAEVGDFAFTTAPADDDARPVKLAISADLDESLDYDSPIFDAAARERPDLFVMLGDWPYADNGPQPAITRDDYHARYLVNRLVPRVQPWLRSTSFRAIYDDHEFANDWDGAARASDPARHDSATAAWDAWFPRRDPGGPRYRKWRWGAHVECFLLDCRAFRSANAAVDDADKTMLGSTQRAWLLDGLAASTATFCVVLTSVPLDFGHDFDHWRGFQTERNAIFDEVRRLARPVLFIAADQHCFAAHRHRFGIREFQVGPISRGIITPPQAQPGVLARSLQYNFGVLELDAAPRLTFRAVGAYGATFYTESFAPDALVARGP